MRSQSVPIRTRGPQDPRDALNALKTLRIHRLDAPANPVFFANIRDWPRLVESPHLDRSLLGQVPREYQRLALRPTKLEVPEDKNDATTVHSGGS